jgi:arylsulfatase
MNVVWICIDTLRADHTSCYGYWRKTTPVLDRLAAEGVLFPGSRANAVPTGPGFTSMITGQYAVNNRWYLSPYNRPDMLDFPDSHPLFPEMVLDSGGITTAAFDNLFSFASHPKQFVRGFEYYVNVTGSSRPRHFHTVGDRINRRLLPWIRQHADERFFLFVHYWEPHMPYNQPEAFARPFVHRPGSLDDLEVREAPAGYRYVPGWGRVEQIPEIEAYAESMPVPREGFEHPLTIDAYDGEIHYVDHLIGQVLETLDDTGVLDRTAVVVNADHGEQLGQHLGTWDHRGLHEANVFTPLILWRPGLLPQGARPEGHVTHVNLAPTILDLLGVEPSAALDGRSLLPLVRGQAEPERSFVAETLAIRAIVQDGYKYIRHHRADDELYHLADDPMEVLNLMEREPERAASMAAALDSWLQERLNGRPDPMDEQIALFERFYGPLPTDMR